MFQPNFTTGIRLIFQDSKGNYWLGSNQEGVGVFDGKSFQYFSVDNGLLDHQIHSIQETKDGKVYIQTANGVSCYDGKKFQHYQPIIPTVMSSKWAKGAHDLWFSAENKEGVYKYDGQQLNYLAFPNPKVINSYNLYVVTSFSKGKNKMLWIGTYAGIFGYDGEHFTIINDETLGLTPATGLLHIRSVLEDSKGRLWIGNNGIGVLLKTADQIINFSEQQHLIDPKSSRKGDKSPKGTMEHVFAIEEDGVGDIWFADRDAGVWQYDGDTMRNYTNGLGDTNEFVHTIYKDQKDELWFILTNGTVFKLNGNTFEQQFKRKE